MFPKDTHINHQQKNTIPITIPSTLTVIINKLTFLKKATRDPRSRNNQTDKTLTN